MFGWLTMAGIPLILQCREDIPEIPQCFMLIGHQRMKDHQGVLVKYPAISGYEGKELFLGGLRLIPKLIQGARSDSEDP